MFQGALNSYIRVINRPTEINLIVDECFKTYDGPVVGAAVILLMISLIVYIRYIVISNDFALIIAFLL